MSDESEEACLVNPKSPTLPCSGGGLMPYTDGIIQTFSQYGAQMNSVSRMGSGNSPNIGLNNTNINNRNGGNHYQQGAAASNHGRDQNNDSNTGGSGGGVSSGGRGSQSQESESGELIDYNDDILMSQFHADAIKQTGCGKFQLLASLIIGLGLAGHAIQVYAILYILPSAELEYCIIEHEKSWLGSITLLGLGCGALLWGGLAGRTGRRKTLLSCLAVSAIFSVVAAFMPTYGPFMMARFCAAAGVGGTLPAGASYLCEIAPQYARTRVLSLLGTLGIAGAIFTGGIAVMTVPQTGQMVMIENKEHFSAWHRYLLIISLPTFGAILGLFWLPESPRWLLENGREVEALAIYQKIYRSNRTRGGYTLTELELPGTRTHRHQIPSTVLAGMAYGVHMFFNSFFQLFQKSHARTTILLLSSWAAAIFVFHGLTIFIAEHSKAIEQMNYNQRTISQSSRLYTNILFNSSEENLIFSRVKFQNCTFRGAFLSHVLFENCTFLETEFINVKTSQTKFLNSNFETVKFIDTDLSERHFINCTKNNTEIVRVATSCDQDFDYNIFLDAIWRSNLGGLIPGVIAMACIGEFIHRFGRSRIATTCFGFAAMLCCAFGFLFIDEHVIWTGGTAQGLILAGLAALTVLSIETYTTPLRCTALGLFVCSGHIGALFSGPIYSSLPATTSNFAAALSTFSMVFPVFSSAALKDPCMLL